MHRVRTHENGAVDAEGHAMIVWDGKPPQDDNDGAFAFVVLTLVMWAVVVGAMILR